jgi:ABC-type transport system involved in Fe-S cluster assembly fused permease/ATPase subunit
VALTEVVPFLRPRDRKHAILLYSALGTVILEKITGVLPPLAIRHAVDAISNYADTTSSETIATVNTSSSSSSSDSTTEHTILTSIVAYFVLKTLDSVIGSIQSICQRSISLDAERRFATTLFTHVQLLGATYHLERHAGEVLRVLSRGCDATSTIIDSLLFGLFPTLFEAAVVGMVFARVLNLPSIALTTIASVVLYLLYTVKVTNTRLEQRRRVNEKNEDIGRIETETLINYETVAIFGRERQAALEYDIVRGEYAEERVKMIGLFAWLSLGQDSIRLAGTCVGLLLAGRAAVQGTLSPGSFVVVQLYINQLFQPLSYLGYTYRQITEALADLEKAVKTLKSKPSVIERADALDWDVALEQRHNNRATYGNGTSTGDVDRSSSTTPIMPSGDITFDNVTFKYKIKGKRKKLGGGDVDDIKSQLKGSNKGKKPKMKGFWKGTKTKSGKKSKAWKKIKGNANDEDSDNDDESEKVSVGGIENVSFNIPAGKTAALVGPSGSGKTTIVRLILRLYDVDIGSVLVDGMNVKSLLLHSLRSNIGVVAQDTVLFHSSLRHNIIYGKEDATDEEIWEAVRISALEQLVKSLPDGLDTIVGERGMKLSGGERQRVGMARCIIKSPKLILLDEATSALDSGTEREIQKNILTQETAAALCKGRTTLIIAHRLSTAMKADTILVLEKGRLVEQGTHEQLIGLGVENSMYARMWRDQMDADDSADSD